MKNFICNNCGAQIRRPTAPLKCDACGQQRIGLFRVGPAGPPPAAAQPPAPPPLSASGEPPVGASPPMLPGMPPHPVAAPPLPPLPSVAPPAPVAAATYTPPPAPPPPPLAAPIHAPPPAAPPEEESPTGAWKRPSGRIPTQSPASESLSPARTEKTPPPPAPPSAPPPKRAAAPAPPPAKERPSRREFAEDAPPAEKPSERPSERPSEKPAAKPVKADAPTAATPRARTQTELGTVVWKHPLGTDRAVRQPLRNAPAVGSDGRIYAALGRTLVGLSERDGGIYRLWEYDAKAHIPGSPALGADGRLRIHAGDGKLHCVNLSGEASWEPIAVGEPLGWSSPVVDADGNTWICSYSGGLLRVDAQGTLARNPFYRTRQKFDSTPLIRKNILYVGCEDGFVYAIAIDGSKGRLAWDPLLEQGKTGWFVNSAPVPLADGGLLVAGRDEHLYCFAADGKVAWKVHIRGQMLASPVVGIEGEIYVGVSLEKRGDQSKGRLVSIDPKSRRARWDFEVSRPVESTPVVGDDGVVYFGDNSGTIHAIAPEGRRLWAQAVGSPVRSAGAIAGKRRLVFGLDNGILLGLECSSGGLAPVGWPKYMGTLEQSGIGG